MSYCQCDYETPEFYHVTMIQKARKPRKCYECHKAIQAGESYEHIFAKWDGDVGFVNTCCRCLDLRTYVQAHVPCFCIGHGNVNEDAIETARNWAHEAPGLLFGAYRRQVRIDRAERMV